MMKATWSGRELQQFWAAARSSERLRRLDRRLKRVAKLDRLFNIGKFDLIKEYKL